MIFKYFIQHTHNNEKLCKFIQKNIAVSKKTEAAMFSAFCNTFSGFALFYGNHGIGRNILQRHDRGIRILFDREPVGFAV